MKTIIFTTTAVLVLSAAVNAQSSSVTGKEKKAYKKDLEVLKKEVRSDRKVLRKLKGNQVSYQSKQAFYSDFGNLPVSKWERVDNFDKATFVKDGQVTTAYYDYNSVLVGTVQPKSFQDLPLKAQNEINRKYESYTKGPVILFDDNEASDSDMILFNQQFTGYDNYLVELQNGKKEIVLQVNQNGDVSLFKQIK